MRQTHFTIRRLLNLAAYVAAGMGFAVPAQGGTIDPVGAAPAGIDWQWRNHFEGSGTAQVFDGGPVVERSLNCDDCAHVGFVAFDDTRPGSLGAVYSTGARSDVFAFADQIFYSPDFGTGYSGSSFIEGDRPGGQGGGYVNAWMEFVMPVDILLWEFDFFVTPSEFHPGFTGSTRVVVRNDTAGTVILDVAKSMGMLTTLEGTRGDVIRISFNSQGMGSVPSGLPIISGYDGSLNTNFTIPEPGTGALIVTGILLFVRRRNKFCRRD